MWRKTGGKQYRRTANVSSRPPKVISSGSAGNGMPVTLTASIKGRLRNKKEKICLVIFSPDEMRGWHARRTAASGCGLHVGINKFGVRPKLLAVEYESVLDRTQRFSAAAPVAVFRLLERKRFLDADPVCDRDILPARRHRGLWLP